MVGREETLYSNALSIVILGIFGKAYRVTIRNIFNHNNLF